MYEDTDGSAGRNSTGRGNVIHGYAAREEKYPLPEFMQGAGTIFDAESGCALAIGFITKRETYAVCGYACSEGAPALLHACTCALLELIQDMPVIRTKLLTPEMIWSKLCGELMPDTEMKRYCSMALGALCQGFAGYVQSHTKTPA